MASNSYDEVPYISHPMSYTHPEVLAVVALLAGLQPPAVETARVLELGCSTGANLMPMAAAFPDATFVGIDLSPRQIAMGDEVVRAAGLANLTLRSQSITEFEADAPFDYIICHGVYSWVPVEVRQKILEICRRDLAPNGFAYISYNTLPGWHMRGIIRDLLYFHARHFDTPDEQIANTRGLLEMLITTFGNDPSSFASIIRGEGERLQDEGDHYLFHEHLETFNEPIYFHQFLEQIAAHKLQFVGEATLGNLQLQVAREAYEKLAAIATDPLDLEQYLDFVVSRTFRRSVICRGDLKVGRHPAPTAIEAMYLTAVLRPLNAEFDVKPDVAEKFEAPRGGTITTGDALLKTALLVLAQHWPASLSFGELRSLVSARLREADVDGDALLSQRLVDADPLAVRLMQCYSLGTVELHSLPPTYTTTISDRPRATSFSRFQAAEGLPVSNGRHRTSDDLNDFDRLLLSHLDGTRDRGALCELLMSAVRDGRLAIESGDQTVNDVAAVRSSIDAAIEPSLRRLAGSALLVT